MVTMSSLPRSGRFTAILATIAVATIVVMTALLLWQLRAQELKHAEGETVSLSHIIAEQTARSLQSVDLALDVALDRLAEAEKLGVRFGEIPIHAMLRSRVEGMPQLRSIFIADVDGKIASSALSHPAPDFSVKDRDYFRGIKDRPGINRYVSAPAINRVDKKWTLFISRRVRNAKGNFVGVIAASLDIAYVETLYESVMLDRISPIALYLDNGTLVARSPRAASPDVQKVTLPALGPHGTGQAAFKTVRTEGEDAGITTYHSVSGYPMVLAVGNLDREALASWRDTTRLVVGARTDQHHAGIECRASPAAQAEARRGTRPCRPGKQQPAQGDGQFRHGRNRHHRQRAPGGGFQSGCPEDVRLQRGMDARKAARHADSGAFPFGT
jgi:hypothetical protein